MKRALVFLLSVALPVLATAQVRSDVAEIAKEVQARITELRQAGGFPGMTAAFVLPDGRSFAVSTGVSNEQTSAPMRPSDKLLAGSTGKTFFSAAMLQLADEKRIGLDTKISKWFGAEPWFSRLPNGPDITLRQLMNHSSGIPEHVRSPKLAADLLAQPDKNWTGPELLSYILDEKPAFAAGKGFSYADTNYILVAMVIEKVSGKTAYDEIERRFLKPLKLTNTIPSVSRTLPGLATGYARGIPPFTTTGPTIVDGKLVFNPQMEWGGGGFASTPEDLARWAHALYGGKVLKAESLKVLMEGIPANTGPGDRYGLGVQIRNSPWGTSYGHSGWFPGYMTDVHYFPDLKVAVAVQFNTDDMRKLKMSPTRFAHEVAKVVVSGRGLNR